MEPVCHHAGTNLGPRTLSYNPAENAVLITSDVDGGTYDLYVVPKDARGGEASVSSYHCPCGPQWPLPGIRIQALIAVLC